jgi:hypothetical protein
LIHAPDRLESYLEPARFADQAFQRQFADLSQELIEVFSKRSRIPDTRRRIFQESGQLRLSFFNRQSAKVLAV